MSHFFAYLSRMKYIKRWGLMRNTQEENIQEHSLQVAMLAHALCVINNTVFNGSLDASRATVLAVYHEAAETITGDLPTPVKYFNPIIRQSYKEIEDVASKKLYSMLPEELQSSYAPLFFHEEKDAELWRVVKWADKLCAYIKCVEEIRSGNAEFSCALKTIQQELERYGSPEVNYFMERFAPSFGLTLDEMD